VDIEQIGKDRRGHVVVMYKDKKTGGKPRMARLDQLPGEFEGNVLVLKSVLKSKAKAAAGKELEEPELLAAAGGGTLMSDEQLSKVAGGADETVVPKQVFTVASEIQGRAESFGEFQETLTKQINGIAKPGEINPTLDLLFRMCSGDADLYRRLGLSLDAGTNPESEEFVSKVIRAYYVKTAEATALVSAKIKEVEEMAAQNSLSRDEADSRIRDLKTAAELEIGLHKLERDILLNPAAHGMFNTLMGMDHPRITFAEITELGGLIEGHSSRVCLELVIPWAKANAGKEAAPAVAEAAKINPEELMIDVKALQEAVADKSHPVTTGHALEDRIKNFYRNYSNVEFGQDIAKTDRKLVSPLGMVAISGAA
jgi:hypothetical protein